MTREPDAAAGDDYVPPRLSHLTIGLPLDDRGREAARRHIAEGEHGRKVLAPLFSFPEFRKRSA